MKSPSETEGNAWRAASPTSASAGQLAPSDAQALDNVHLQAVDLRSLRGFAQDDLATALPAFQRQAGEILARGAGFSREVRFAGAHADWLDVCRKSLTATNAREFFSTAFVALHVSGGERPEGLFTGYFEPEVAGSRQQSTEFPVAVYRRPEDLVAFTQAEEAQTGLKYGRRLNGSPKPYFSRSEIENGALHGQKLEICWLESWVEAFFVHIQGSGRVRFADGTTIRLSYAAKSGLPYTGIGGVLVERGDMRREALSMQGLKTWMAQYPQQARELMWLNRSFVFFREILVPDETLGAVGAAQVNLTPGRSLAVDRSLWTFGTPMWIETSYPPEAARPKTQINRLMIAQDTGSAIKGLVRGDFYWGWGDEAALIAGHMKSAGRMHALLPHAVAKRLGLRFGQMS